MKDYVILKTPMIDVRRRSEVINRSQRVWTAVEVHPDATYEHEYDSSCGRLGDHLTRGWRNEFFVRHGALSEWLQSSQ